MSEPKVPSAPEKLKPVPKRKHTAKSSDDFTPEGPLRLKKASATRPKRSGRQPSPKKAPPSKSRIRRAKPASPLDPPADPFKEQPAEAVMLPPVPLYKPAVEESGFETNLSSIPLDRRDARSLFLKSKLFRIGICGLVFLFFAFGLHEVGRVGGFHQAEAARPLRVKADAKSFEAINAACRHLRAAEGREASAILDEVAKRAPDTRSLAYLRALASLQSGDLFEAAAHAKESLRRQERESDALVILSLAEAGSAAPGALRDAKVVREAKLREAVDADPSNSAPMLELANILRVQGRNDEALDVLKAADSRLLPVDPHVVVSTSIRLIELQATPDSKLPDPVADGPLPELFSSLYIALRKNRRDLVGELEAKCRLRSTPELFAYISGDPAFREFRNKPVNEPAL
jgi:tetratricopeptide (TPR) repeat protein